jgi:hypothetical protein
MTLREKYYDKVKELLTQHPEFSTRQIAHQLKYRGNIDSLQRQVVSSLRKELGINHKHNRINQVVSISIDEKLSMRSDESFEMFDENGDAFTDGFWIDPTPYKIPSGQRVLVVNDTHIGIHKVVLCEAPFRYVIEQNIHIDTIVLNGDIIDCASASSHAESPYEDMTLKEEIDQCKLYLKWIHRLFPNTKIVYAEGNHEYRIKRYMAMHAKQCAGQVSLDRWLDLNSLDITFVPYHSHVLLGNLNIMHGHHIKGSGANVAQTLLNKAGVNIMFGDRHRSQEAFNTRFDGTTIGAWAVGCLCPLSVSYSLYNPQWTNGFAIVDSHEDGTFTVDNKKIIEGKIY